MSPHEQMRPHNAPQRFSPSWTGEKWVWGWRHWTDHQVKLSTCHLIMVIIVSQSGNTSGCSNDPSGESQETEVPSARYCQPVPRGVSADLSGLHSNWHHSPFQRASLCGASSVERNICVGAFAPSGLHSLEISQEETCVHLTSLHWAPSNLLVLGHKLCTRKGKLGLCIHVDLNSRKQSFRTDV